MIAQLGPRAGLLVRALWLAGALAVGVLVIRLATVGPRVGETPFDALAVGVYLIPAAL